MLIEFAQAVIGQGFAQQIALSIFKHSRQLGMMLEMLRYATTRHARNLLRLERTLGLVSFRLLVEGRRGMRGILY